MTTSHEHLLDIHALPERGAEFRADWDSVFVPERIKQRLLSYIDTLRRLATVPATALALRRAILLYGPPGCGKTSLARGLPAEWCARSGAPRAGFIHVNTHALASGVRGEGQKNVLKVFQRIEEAAASGAPTFALLDEVETLGTDRSAISLQTNPVDTLYQVNAFLESMDRCVRRSPNVIFVLTTNIPKAIDRAVRERVDFALEVPPPDADRRSLILRDAILSLGAAFDVKSLLLAADGGLDDPDWSKIVEASTGFSGRTLRHVLIVAATHAGHEELLSVDHVLSALHEIERAERALLSSGGVYTEKYQGNH
jgi:pachytene checkpoint protein 2